MKDAISIIKNGTEPKCKFYIEVVDKSLKKADERCDKYYKELVALLHIEKNN